MKEKLTLEFASSMTKLCRISLSTALGQLVFRPNNPEAVQILDLRFLAAGLYFLTVQNVGVQEVFKIIKE